MSLALAAKHLESQGRGKDTHLVHMTPNELRALNKLSLDHAGKPLSTNPKTGLPEAGFLESVLPTVLGVAGTAMGIPMPLLVGGIGLATAALTGDIGQGIMAGLGAWSGGKLGADIKSAGNLVQKNAAAIPQATLDASNAVANTTGFNPALVGTPAQSIVDTTGGLANIGSTGTVDKLGNAITSRSASDIMKPLQTVNAPPPDSWRQSLDQFKSGADYAINNPMEFLSREGVGMNTAMAVAPPLLELAMQQPELQIGKKEEENPFGLKRISKDFKGSFPTQPNPYYTAQYPDYRARPYGMNDGGLADVERYAKGRSVNASKMLRSSEDVMSGIQMATRRPMAQIPEQGDVGIYEDERKYAGLDPYERSLAVLKDIKKSTGMSTKRLPDLESIGTLGAISTDPALSEEMMAQQAQQQILNDYYKSAKSGGIMRSGLGDYSDGGRLLKGPGDGVSDSIPASIAGKQPARLAEGEFVIPARIVSELGNGSTDAGAKRLYAMMDRIKAKRKKAKDIAADTKAYKLLPV